MVEHGRAGVADNLVTPNLAIPRQRWIATLTVTPVSEYLERMIQLVAAGLKRETQLALFADFVDVEHRGVVSVDRIEDALRYEPLSRATMDVLLCHVVLPLA